MYNLKSIIKPINHGKGEVNALRHGIGAAFDIEGLYLSFHKTRINMDGRMFTNQAILQIEKEDLIKKNVEDVLQGCIKCSQTWFLCSF